MLTRTLCTAEWFAGNFRPFLIQYYYFNIFLVKKLLAINNFDLGSLRSNKTFKNDTISLPPPPLQGYCTLKTVYLGADLATEKMCGGIWIKSSGEKQRGYFLSFRRKISCTTKFGPLHFLFCFERIQKNPKLFLEISCGCQKLWKVSWLACKTHHTSFFKRS